jgi:hypothetical protein
MLPAFHSVGGVFIEFTKTDHGHGGPGWEFGTCLWSPTANSGGAKSYALMEKPQKGDLVLHFLLSQWPDGVEETRVAGISIVSNACRVVSEEPPLAGKWAGRDAYFRIDLKGYSAFPTPLPMRTLIDVYGEEIRAELIENAPEFYPFNRYGQGLHTVQGIYLARCTENLYLILSKVLGIEVAIPDGPLEPLNEHKEYAEAKRMASERYFFARNPKLRKDAILHYGTTCQVCGFNFGLTYGEFGKGYIEVHHLDPLSERSEKEWTDELRTTLEQVAVICANCHRMAHRTKPSLPLESLRAKFVTPVG